MTKQTNPCGCGSLPRTLITGRGAERPSPESSPLVAVSGGRAEAKRSRPERPALPKSAGGPARDCGPPGAGAPLEPQFTGYCAGVRSTAGVGSPVMPHNLYLHSGIVQPRAYGETLPEKRETLRFATL